MNPFTRLLPHFGDDRSSDYLKAVLTLGEELWDGSPTNNPATDAITFLSNRLDAIVMGQISQRLNSLVEQYARTK
jgi:hypothetical protein